jgi:outer membrane immunogenic protein
MKRTLAVLGVLAAASVTPALAADLSRPVYKAPPPVAAPVPYYSWSGFYIGGHAGAGWAGNDDQTFSVPGVVAPIALGSSNDAGFVGGGQIGYNWQIAPNWLIGIEGDISAADINSSGSATLGAASVAMSRDLNWLASVRGRVGYTWDRFMVYATGGGAWASYDYAATASFAGVTATNAFSDTKSGWVVGGGGEWAFAPNWTVGVEYLHYQFDGASTAVPTAAGTANFNWSDPSVDVVRARLNFKFGDWFGKSPVATRY